MTRIRIEMSEEQAIFLARTLNWVDDNFNGMSDIFNTIKEVPSLISSMHMKDSLMYPSFKSGITVTRIEE